MKSAAEKLISAVTALCQKITVGDPSADISALFTERSAENVIAMLKEAQSGGAMLAFGNATRDGALVWPHVVVGGKPGMRLWDRESFGPGPCSLPF